MATNPDSTEPKEIILTDQFPQTCADYKAVLENIQQSAANLKVPVTPELVDRLQITAENDVNMHRQT